MDQQLLAKLWGDGKTVKEIAEAVGSTHGVVNYWLIKYGLRTQAYKRNQVEEDTLRQMAEVQKIQRDVIADHFGVTQGAVMSCAKKWGITLPKWNEWKGYPHHLTPEQDSFLLGTLLGDGHIQIPTGSTRSAQYYAHHGPKQRGYIEWKRLLMLDFMSNAYKESVKSDLTGFHFCTGCNPLFLEWRRLFYKGRQKVYRESVARRLTPLSLAVWYMDEGTLTKGYPEITTHLHPDQAEMFEDALFDIFGIDAYPKRISRDTQKRVKLGIRGSSRKKFIEIIFPHIHPTLRYKLGLEQNLGEQPHSSETVSSQRDYMLGTRKALDTETEPAKVDGTVKEGQGCNNRQSAGKA